VEEGRGQHGVGSALDHALVEVLEVADAARGDDGDGDEIGDRAGGSRRYLTAPSR
jgi:hypothetical protein